MNHASVVVLGKRMRTAGLSLGQVMTNYSFVAADSWDICNWSYGRVKVSSDLYSQRIFGPRQDGRCECGRYAGAECAGVICDKCGVVVATDASALSMLRMGHIELAYLCRHPMAKGEILDRFPVAPIGYRLRGDVPTPLGRRYEELMRANELWSNRLPPRQSEEYYPAVMKLDTSELEAVIAGIIGSPNSAAIADSVEVNCLMPLVADSIPKLSPGTVSLIRSCCLAMKIESFRI